MEFHVVAEVADSFWETVYIKPEREPQSKYFLAFGRKFDYKYSGLTIRIKDAQFD